MADGIYQVLVFFALAGLVAVTAYAGRQLFQWVRILRVARTAQQIQERLDFYINRLKLLEPLAEQHLDPTMGAGLLAKAASVVAEMDKRLSSINHALQRGGTSEVAAAEVELAVILNQESWEETLEYLIQRMGSSICTMSDRHSSERPPSGRRRRPTLLALDLAGIAPEMRRRQM